LIPSMSSPQAIGWNGLKWVIGGTPGSGGSSILSLPTGLFSFVPGIGSLPTNCFSVAWTGNVWVASDGSGTSGVCTSPDGITWTSAGLGVQVHSVGVKQVRPFLITPFGVTGRTGPTGPTGFQGSLGVFSFSGTTGPTGLTGYTGWYGFYGPTGRTGVTGITGVQATGCTGRTGPTGSTFSAYSIALGQPTTTTTTAVAAGTVYSNIITFTTGIPITQRVTVNEFFGQMTDSTYFRFTSLNLSNAGGLWTLDAQIVPLSTLAATTTYTVQTNAIKINVYN
jgi:hypothetical protein